MWAFNMYFTLTIKFIFSHATFTFFTNLREWHLVFWGCMEGGTGWNHLHLLRSRCTFGWLHTCMIPTQSMRLPGTYMVKVGSLHSPMGKCFDEVGHHVTIPCRLTIRSRIILIHYGKAWKWKDNFLTHNTFLKVDVFCIPLSDCVTECAFNYLNTIQIVS